MKEATELVTRLACRGVKVWAENSKIRFMAPKGALTPNDLQDIGRYKPELLIALRDGEVWESAPIRPRSIAPRIPLIAALERAVKWHLNGHKSQRICVSSMRLVGRLDSGALRASLEYVIDRHEALRTTFAVRDGVPLHYIKESSACELELVDLTDAPSRTLNDEVQQRGGSFAREKIDICRDPLLAAKLFRLSAREHVLILAIDHLISDAQSQILISKELFESYDRLLRRDREEPASLPLQFGDYAVWQDENYLAWLGMHGGYWISRLGSAPAALLPVDNSGNVDDTSATQGVSIDFGSDVSNNLRKLSRTEGRLLSVTMLAVYAVAASRWLHQNDLTIAVVVDGRFRAELQSIVGFMVNFLHLRIEIAESDTWQDVLAQVDAEFQNAYEHQDFNRVPDLIPHFKGALYFNWSPYYWSRWLTAEEIDSPCSELDVCRFPLRDVRPRMHFSPFFFDTAAGLAGVVEYSPDVFKRPSIETFCREVARAARECASDPSAPVSRLQRN